MIVFSKCFEMFSDEKCKNPVMGQKSQSKMSPGIYIYSSDEERGSALQRRAGERTTITTLEPLEDEGTRDERRGVRAKRPSLPLIGKWEQLNIVILYIYAHAEAQRSTAQHQ